MESFDIIKKHECYVLYQDDEETLKLNNSKGIKVGDFNSEYVIDVVRRNSMREKKIRGIKRKTKNMIKRIYENTMEFPSEFYNDYWHMHLPVAQNFANSNKIPIKIKRLCIQALLDRAEYLIRIKSNNKEKFRVVVAVDLPELWSSQIIVFKGESYFNNFFNRNDEYQKWLHLSDERNIQTEWGLSVSNEMHILGFKEVITDEDGYQYEGEIWFIGELK